MAKPSATLLFGTPSEARAAPRTTGKEVLFLSRFKDAGVFALVLLLALGIVFMAVAVQESAAMHRQAVTVVTRLQMQAYRHSALE